MGDIVLGTPGVTVLSESGGTATLSNCAISNSVNGGKGLHSEPDTSSTNLQNTSMAKNTALPIFACRAWVVFNGEQVDGLNNCELYSSANILKVVREGTGYYKVHFQESMPDAYYCIIATGTGGGTSSGYVQLDSSDFGGNGSDLGATSTTFNLRATNSSGTYTNHPVVNCAVFR